MTSKLFPVTFALMLAVLSVPLRTTAQAPVPGPVAGQTPFVRVYAPDTTSLVLPVLLREVKPNYTPEALRANIQGKVVLEITVGPDGHVRDALLKKGLDAELDATAVAAMRTWLFKPGTLDGKPVPVRLATVAVTFSVY